MRVPRERSSCLLPFSTKHNPSPRAGLREGKAILELAAHTQVVNPAPKEPASSRRSLSQARGAPTPYLSSRPSPESRLPATRPLAGSASSPPPPRRNPWSTNQSADANRALANRDVHKAACRPHGARSGRQHPDEFARFIREDQAKRRGRCGCANEAAVAAAGIYK
jgi:hypothetical protein